jgi:hypothetical protein
LFGEAQLRSLLTMLGHDGHPRTDVAWDPAWGIKAVNTIAPLGKGKALAAIEEFVRVPLISLATTK